MKLCGKLKSSKTHTCNHWYQGTISLTNRIRLCILDMCDQFSQLHVRMQAISSLAPKLSYWYFVCHLH